jgi:hypothetical protein
MRFSFAGFAIAALLCAAPAAHASDASLKSTVKTQQAKLKTPAKHYAAAVKTVKTNAQLEKAKTETQTLAGVVQTFHDKVKAETADSAKYKTARTKLLGALATYHKGLEELISAINANRTSKVRTALKTIITAAGKFDAARKAFA